MKRIRLILIKISRYEFWPFWLFYLPMYFYGLFLAIRAGSFTYFSALNPAMKYGGAFQTSKFAMLSQLPAELRPGGILLPAGTGTEWVFREIEKAGLKFPLVAKPDIGERGKGVELLKTRDEMVRYLGEHGGDIILQEYIDLPYEFGILYFRYPDGSREEISSIMIRDFLVVEGDGRSSLEELIHRNPRALSRKKYLQVKFGHRFSEILPSKKVLLLEPIGNHNRGTRFLDGNHLMDPRLLRLVSDISSNLDGFYYGRFDLKVESPDSLYNGEGLRILEINGANSEPAHIYDPDGSLLTAYKVILKHMKVIFEIARINHRKGLPYASFRGFLCDLFRHVKHPPGSR